MVVRIGYRTMDPVNEAEARALADDTGVALITLFPKDGLRGEGIDALACDLDAFGRDDAEDLAKELLRRPLARPTLVHSYNLRPEQDEALRRHGVIVCRRLEGPAFVRLAEAAVASRRAAAG